MKNLLIKPRVLIFALVSMFTMAITTPALAIDDKKEIPVEMKFIGNVANQPLFAMSFTGDGESEFTITIRDEFGNLLYRDQVKGNATKKFLLNSEELNDVALVFQVRGNKTHKTAVFEINKYSRTVEDVVVSKLK